MPWSVDKRQAAQTRVAKAKACVRVKPQRNLLLCATKVSQGLKGKRKIEEKEDEIASKIRLLYFFSLKHEISQKMV